MLYIMESGERKKLSSITYHRKKSIGPEYRKSVQILYTSSDSSDQPVEPSRDPHYCTKSCIFRLNVFSWERHDNITGRDPQVTHLTADLEVAGSNPSLAP